MKKNDAMVIMLSLVCSIATRHDNIYLHYILVRRHVHGEYAYVVRIAYPQRDDDIN
jgi:hypothetical protein